METQGRIDLGALDEPQPFALDPSVWDANLAALRREQPDFAAQLERTPLPPHWRAGRALDGWISYRVEASGEPPAWLAGTAVPRTRAEAWLAALSPGEYNPSLPSVEAGAELDYLLRHLSDYRAVYVFETDLVALAAVLRTTPLAEAIENGRCILVPPAREEGFLLSYLGHHPGLLPPGAILRMPGTTPARIDALRVLCERVSAHVHRARADRLKALQEAVPVRAETAWPPRLAIIALTPDRASGRTSAAFESAARSLGWPVLRCIVGGPRDAHVLAHCEKLASFDPTLTFGVDTLPTRLPIPLAGATAQWFTNPAAVPAQLPQEKTLWLAASPLVATALRAAAGEGARVADLFWPAEVSETEPPAPGAEGVFLVADLPDDGVSACGIDQPSHRQLWDQLRQVVARHWETREILDPAALLVRAERDSGIRPREQAVRARLLHLLETVLIPAVLAQTIGRVAVSQWKRVQAIGRGWPRAAGQEISPLGESLFDLPEAGRPRPAAAIFAGSRDPLTPALVQAAALAWPILLHCPPGRDVAETLGGVLRANRHVTTFADASGLRAALQAIRKDPAEAGRRAVQAREHIREHHTYARRLEQLAALAAQTRAVGA